MADKKDFVIKEEENGIVNIGEEVIAIIAGLAATEVDGVVSLVGNLTNELISKAGGSKLAKGIKVVTNESDKIAVKVAVNISYGYEIPIICQQIQEKVKASVENMTGLDVVSVDVKNASVDVANE